ncbi:hypothetical protein ALI144C_39445 [Actinosynnema sp. ALI-1.44]|uniref:hypothetical protein n=1 Tax=Actinosynnema sp. ALI-1.44 TaxID=1933779 RepID=UPI00097C6987|nr:hypothetical protein [Actinosynnema sp. ALI-1.44]ONI74866.1 hypothetical protein ALI144C_39445 [Actinosynnema sp. ALI-1.44]
MEPLRTWTIPGDETITLSVYRPAVTIRCGDGPEVTISPDQVTTLSDRFVDVDNFFASGEPGDL